MKPYHDSNSDSTVIDLSKSKDRRDSGRRFYLAMPENQAENRAEILFKRYGSKIFAKYK
jgi:hypothetical protein